MFDIRPYKKELREKCKKIRIGMTAEHKERLDRKIANKLLNMWIYREAETLFLYVSKDIEVDTFFIISESLKRGKRVAVPRCVEGTRNMDFYLINSLDDLEEGSFGVLEPKTQVCEKLTDFSKGLCIVPALAFDKLGYRLGYGKGYYDRFLSNFKATTVGICYNSCVQEKNLLHGKFDRRVKYLITESLILDTEA
ncbi:MAG: 5-formyltetrahydrofolate cyclo-ligase [Clostridia bacterium]|nr:5-formyltetrahydrofolate cyclo-ligase [Clostridia bacterium]